MNTYTCTLQTRDLTRNFTKGSTTGHTRDFTQNLTRDFTKNSTRDFRHDFAKGQKETISTIPQRPPNSK